MRTLLSLPALALWLLASASFAQSISDATTPHTTQHPLTPPDVLIIDRPPMDINDLAFPNERNIRPSAGDFELVSYFLLSGENGERWATITLRNTSSGQRYFRDGHLLALFANGERRPPMKLKQRFSGRETLTLNIFFGFNKFPILSLYTANDL